LVCLIAMDWRLPPERPLAPSSEPLNVLNG
jgi:hypothetical protein